MAALVQVVLLIANAGTTFFTILLLMRFFMQLVRAPFDSPIGSFVLNLTNWLVLPLRRIVPAIRGFDSASLLAAYLLQTLLLALAISLSSSHQLASVGSMLRIAVDGLFVLVRVSVYLYVILLIAQAMLSAGLVGVFIAEAATFAAEVGGCQVECGAGSGMAATARETAMRKESRI